VSLGVLLAGYFGNIPLRLSGFSATTVRGVAMAKLGETLPIVMSILGVHFATGGKPDGLFLKQGNLKLWLAAGVLGFAAFAGFGAMQAIGLGLNWEAVAQALPWIALFVFCNAFMEELWFRALFLKRLQPVTGEWIALFMTSLVFALLHISVTYVLDVLIFLVGLMALGLLWGWLMQRSHSLWGSVLIHAGGDVLILLGFLAESGG
jgi:membrane protease YdiL (CAAX protease family)